MAYIASMSGMMKPMALRNAANTFPRCARMPFHNGLRTLSNDSIPYGVAASASAAMESAVMVRTFWFSSPKPFSMMSTKDLRCGSTAHP